MSEINAIVSSGKRFEKKTFIQDGDMEGTDSLDGGAARAVFAMTGEYGCGDD